METLELDEQVELLEQVQDEHYITSSFLCIQYTQQLLKYYIHISDELRLDLDELEAEIMLDTIIDDLGDDLDEIDE